MIFSFLTKWLIQRRVKRSEQGEFRPLNQTQRLLLLVQETDLESIIPVIPEVAQCGVKITLVIEAQNLKNLPTAIPGCYPVLPLETYWLLQSPTYDFMKSFSNNDGDVLIDLSTTPSLAMTYLAAVSQAVFKIGASKKPFDFYDLQVLIPEVEEPEPVDESDLETPAPPTMTVGDLLRHTLFYWQKIGIAENNT